MIARVSELLNEAWLSAYNGEMMHPHAALSDACIQSETPIEGELFKGAWKTITRIWDLNKPVTARQELLNILDTARQDAIEEESEVEVEEG